MSYGIVVVVLIVLLLFSTFRILNEYERGVMLTLGRFYRSQGAGHRHRVSGVAADAQS